MFDEPMFNTYIKKEYDEPVFNTFIKKEYDQVVSRKPSMVSLEEVDSSEPQTIIPSGALCWSSPPSSHAILPSTLYTPDNSASSTASDQGSYFSSVLSYSPDSPNIISPPLGTDDTMYGWFLPSNDVLETNVQIDLSSSSTAIPATYTATAITPSSSATSLNSLILPGQVVDSIYSNTTIWSPAPTLSQFNQVDENVSGTGAAGAPSSYIHNHPITPDDDTDDELNIKSESRAAAAAAAVAAVAAAASYNTSSFVPINGNGQPQSISLSMIQHVDTSAIPISPPSSSPPPLSPQQTRERQNEIIKKMSYTKWVKLSRMSEQRISKIKALAIEKGIDIETVESVLTLYSNTKDKEDNEVNRFRGEDVYIKITMGSGAFVANNDDSCDVTTTPDGTIIKKKKHRKQKPHYVKRPLNSFMLYRKSQTQSAMAYAMSSQLRLNHQNISQIIGLMWQTESKELKEEFAHIADQEKELHRALHPDYKFCPQKKKRSVSIDS